MATHYTNALPSPALPDLTTNSFRLTETLDDLPIVAKINLVEEDTVHQ